MKKTLIVTNCYHDVISLLHFALKLELPISLSLVTRLEMVDARKRLNLVHEELSEVPIKIVKKYGKDVKELDLSYNYIQCVTCYQTTFFSSK